MKKMILLLVFLILTVGCTQQYSEDDLPPFPAAPIGQAVSAISSGVSVIPQTTTFNGKLNLTVRHTGGEDIYAVYRNIFFESSYTNDKVNNNFPKQSSDNTILTQNYPKVQGTLDLSKLNITSPGTYEVGIVAYKLVNGIWDTQNYYSFSEDILILSPTPAQNQTTVVNITTSIPMANITTTPQCAEGYTECVNDITLSRCVNGTYINESCSFLCANGVCTALPSQQMPINQTQPVNQTQPTNQTQPVNQTQPTNQSNSTL